MDVIFNVNVSTTKGERWSIDIQPEVRLSPVHHTLTLTLRPRSENHLAASLTSSSMHTHQRLNYSLRIFTQSCYSPTFCCSCFHTESRKLPDGFVLIFNGIYLRANRKYTGKHISDWNVLHPSYLTQITINTFLSSPRKHCTVYNVRNSTTVSIASQLCHYPTLISTGDQSPAPISPSNPVA